MCFLIVCIWCFMAFQPPKAFTGRHHRRDLWHHRGSQLWVWSPCWGSLWGDGGKLWKIENKNLSWLRWEFNICWSLFAQIAGQKWRLMAGNILSVEFLLLNFQWHPTNGVKFLPICNVLVVREGTVWISKQLTYVDYLFLLSLFNQKYKLNEQKCRLTVQWFGTFSLMFARMDTSMTCSY